MNFEKIKSDIFSNYNKTGLYPKSIILNKDLMSDLKQAGYISLSASDPSKVTFLGVEVLNRHDVETYEIIV